VVEIRNLDVNGDNRTSLQIDVYAVCGQTGVG
jgi:hypothetical protein